MCNWNQTLDYKKCVIELFPWKESRSVQKVAHKKSIVLFSIWLLIEIL